MKGVTEPFGPSYKIASGVLTDETLDTQIRKEKEIVVIVSSPRNHVSLWRFTISFETCSQKYFEIINVTKLKSSPYNSTLGIIIF